MATKTALQQNTILSYGSISMAACSLPNISHRDLLDAAKCSWDNSKPAEAIAFLSQYISFYPLNSSALMLRVRWNISVGNYKCAVEDLASLPHKGQDACEFLSICHYHLGNYDSCVLFFEKCSALYIQAMKPGAYCDTITVDWRFKVASSYFRMGRHMEAFRELDKLLCWLHENLFPKAGTLYDIKHVLETSSEETLKLCSAKLLYHILLTHANLRLRLSTSTSSSPAMITSLHESILEDALLMHPALPDGVHLNVLIAFISFGLKNYKQCLKHCQLILDKEPDNYYAGHCVMNLLAVLGKYEACLLVYLERVCTLEEPHDESAVSSKHLACICQHARIMTGVNLNLVVQDVQKVES